MKQGWVSVYRQIQEHWIWQDKPFSRGQAWIDMILLANHEDNKFLLGNEVVSVKPGSFITSEVKLAERWGWSKTKVRSFLRLLQNDSMIVKKADQKKTTITIENYSVYQNPETIKKPVKNRKETDKKPPRDTNNNDNNDNNENNENNKYNDDPKLDAAIQEFITFRKKIKKPMTDHAVKLMLSKLNKLTSDIDEQVEILNQSILNGWQGIYPLKREEKKSGQNGIVIDESKDDLDDLF